MKKIVTFLIICFFSVSASALSVGEMDNKNDLDLLFRLGFEKYAEYNHIKHLHDSGDNVESLLNKFNSDSKNFYLVLYNPRNDPDLEIKE